LDGLLKSYSSDGDEVLNKQRLFIIDRITSNKDTDLNEEDKEEEDEEDEVDFYYHSGNLIHLKY
jgi:hypothetical protein